MAVGEADDEVEQHEDAIAIVGMAGRFPGADDLAAFWRNLVAGVESISTFTDDEILAAEVPSEVAADPAYVKARAVLDGVDLFDPAFFGISPREAEAMDPQQRLFLACAWQALEDAGYDPLGVPGAVGVWGGCGPNSYARHNVARNPHFLAQLGAFGSAIVHYANYLTTRVSYKLDLKGPSVEVATACSTSLVAVAHACTALLTYQCDVALAGGVSIGVPQRVGYLYQQGEIFSRDGHCRPFDHQASGTVGGEGCGLVVLKRLEDALADRDTIRALILGAAMNNDGGDKVGFTAPSVSGQAEVIAAALELAGVEAESIGYVEAHGTATPLGDPIEIAGLVQAYRARTDAVQFCGIGSVKSNIAHADAAAGVAGLIKATQVLEHGEIPPTLHFERPNPEIDFARSPFFPVAERTPWPRGERPRRAAVSSFGIGGTNAHVVLQEAPAPRPASAARRGQLLVLSARTAAAVDRAAAELSAWLQAHPDASLADVAFTLQAGRHAFEHRRAVVAANADEAAAGLRSPDPRRSARGRHSGGPARVALLFPGQGAQYPGMGRGLYDGEPVYRERFDRCAELLRGDLGLDLRELLFDTEAERAAELLGQTRVTQPVLFAVEYALAELWRSWGVEPAVMAGHSIGEWVAAHLAGVFSLPDALALVAARGRLMQSLPPGDMLAVALPADDVREILDERLSVAAINGPSQCVVSGPSEPIEELRAACEAEGVGCRALHTSHAFHSAMMEPIVAEFVAAVAAVERQPASLPCVSTVTGALAEAGDWTDPDYWGRNLRQPVRFADAALSLLATPDCALLEVGPGQTLGSLVRLHEREAAGRCVVSSMRHPKRQDDDVLCALGALGELWVAGVVPDWPALQGGARQRVPLPTYSFDLQRYWVDPAPDAAAERPMVRHGDVADWVYAPSWRRSVAPAAQGHAGWLVFADPRGVGDAVLEHLRGEGEPVVVVRAGAVTGALADGELVLDPADRDGHRAAVAAVRALGMPRCIAVHAWAIEPDPARSGQLAFESLLHLAAAAGGEPLALAVITDDLLEVCGEAVRRPERATLLGACTVIPQEQPHLPCRHIDVESAALGDPAALARRLVAEALAWPPEPVVAYRGGHRWVQEFEPVPLPPAPPASWRRGGAYLLVGGLGGLGLVLAKKLAEAGGARLVLTGYSAFPPREQWDDWCRTHGDGDRTSRRIAALRELEQRAAEVVVLQADAADRAQLAAVVAETKRRFDAVCGVVHCAGVAAPHMVDEPFPASSAAVLQPKLVGAPALAELCAGEPLEFFVLCSSLSARLGGIASVDYTAANAFLDAFAHSRPHVVSIDWDAWREVGLAAGDDSDAVRQGIDPAAGAELFARILAHPLPQVVVSTRDLPSRLARSRAWLEHGAERIGEVPGAGSAGRHARPALPVDYASPTNETERVVAGAVEELLGLERVGIHDNLFDLGFDSLLATRLTGRLRGPLGIDLPLRVALEIPTVAQIAEFAVASKAALGP